MVASQLRTNYFIIWRLELKVLLRSGGIIFQYNLIAESILPT